jgi:hypothetical protein
MAGRENPLQLGGDYLITWSYSHVATERFGQFRFLAVEVLPD